MRVLLDGDVLERTRADEAVELMSEALARSYRGELASPPRVLVDAGAARFTFTVGGVRDGVSGFRIYGDWPGGGEQIVPVWEADGTLLGIVVGGALATLRTGALGGAAVAALARADSRRLGVIGSGRIAWAQVWATMATRPIDRVDVFSPTRAHRERFAQRVAAEFGVAAYAVDDAREAASDHDIVIVSTDSTSAIVDAEWISPGTHVTSTGPKSASGSELDARMVERADVVVSDSPQQADATVDGWFTDLRPAHLGAIIAGVSPGRRRDDDLTLYLSTGLAGTEVLLAERLLRAYPGTIRSYPTV
ncbi:MAG TPA: hypothetical protein VNS80_06480 [Pseudolysinimonas sp.]|nr:hypothetical protein [Pseudolysinimonas sp.]